MKRALKPQEAGSKPGMDYLLFLHFMPKTIPKKFFYGTKIGLSLNIFSM